MSRGLCSVEWSEYGCMRKSGDNAGCLGTLSVPVTFILHVVHLINVGFNVAWLVGYCVATLDFIVEGGQPIGRCDGDFVDVAILIG